MMQVSVFDFELNARNRRSRFLAFNSKSKTETCIGIANQGNPRGSPPGRSWLSSAIWPLCEPPWTNPSTPEAFVAATPTI